MPRLQSNHKRIANGSQSNHLASVAHTTWWPIGIQSDMAIAQIVAGLKLQVISASALTGAELGS